MKYDKAATEALIAKFNTLLAENVEQAEAVKILAAEFNVPNRSIVAKLASLQLYRKKGYLNKQGTLPVKKEEYIDRIAKLMEVNAELLDSLEKVNKNVLILLEKALS